jgi:voltage-gated potassium channel
MREVGTKSIFRRLVKDRAGSALVTLLLMGILVLEFGSVQILAIESQSPDANIKTASDALWYTIVTIATVGYGDRYPTTNAGRLVGSLLIVIGVGIFGTFTGYLANFFLSPPKEKPMPERIQPAPDDLQFRVEQLNQLMAQQQEAIDEINRLLQNQ